MISNSGLSIIVKVKTMLCMDIKCPVFSLRDLMAQISILNIYKMPLTPVALSNPLMKSRSFVMLSSSLRLHTVESYTISLLSSLKLRSMRFSLMFAFLIALDATPTPQSLLWAGMQPSYTVQRTMKH